ncbi:MAG: DUF192 domain-containing protein [Clostridia bacterium]|nr:DUF192 domain-containing protein [Clostridia bacterium]
MHREFALIKDHIIMVPRVRLADTFLQRFLGLMGKKSLSREEGLLLKGCRQIHTFFMRMTIDVLFLDKDGQIIAVLPELAPGKISPLVKGAGYVLELPAGSIREYDFREGQQLKLIPQTTKSSNVPQN